MANARNELEKVKNTPLRRSPEDGPMKSTSPKFTLQEKKERMENSRRVMNVLNSVASNKLSTGRLSDEEYGTDDDIDYHPRGRGSGNNKDSKERLTVITKDLFNNDDDQDYNDYSRNKYR